MNRIIIPCVVALLAARSAFAQSVDYARDVLPILSAKCYACHGPDEEARQKELRLDMKDGAFRVEDGVAVIVPGKPADSEMIRRITSSDPEEVMPPVDDIRKLTKSDIDALRRWVEQGAKWGEHWAFVAPQQTAGGSIDAIVTAALSQKKLSPAPEADRATLIRRVTLDLTGLPPTPSEIDAFIADRLPNAYEKLLDRLLASRRYGERMAGDWLDLARYADTHGYQMDRPRAMWPYRDWVIKAFNENLPLDQFITWQLAGDLLPNSTKDQRLATAFNRLHMQNEEGGVVEEEFRVAYVVDRVTTMGTAFLGLTFECARCHDHKFDPITQRDFYSLFAFFQNIDESGQTSFFTDSMPVPAMLLTNDEQDKKLDKIRADIASKETELRANRDSDATAESFKQWLALRGDPPTDFTPHVERALKKFADSKSLRWLYKKPNPGEEDPPKPIPGKISDAVELSGENGLTYPGGVGQFSRTDSFTLGLWINSPAVRPRMTVLHKSKAPIDAGSRGYELLLENGHLAVGLHHMWPANALKVVTKQSVAINQWTHVAVTYDGSSRAAGVRIYINGERTDLEIIRDGLTRDITYGGNEPNLAIGYRFRDNGFKGGKVDGFRIYNRALTPIEILRLSGREADFETAWQNDRAKLLDYYLATTHEQWLVPSRQLTELRKEENTLVMSIAEVMVMNELATPKPAFVLKRGSYDAPLDKVTAATPAFLPPFPSDEPRNRLGLARWITASTNPLTGRVIVNRAWQQMFGRGIVETSENLGTQGAQPSNQDLLDALARAFVDDMHWDMKRLLKSIALSQTYRQSSRASSDLLQRDPDNKLLARQAARRLSAEMLRDQALFDSNLLVEKIGGPSVKPYQPDGLWSVALGNPHYDQDKGEGLYRRSLYTFTKRSVPPPAMSVFDAADKNICTARRQSTSTPLQALTLLNDIQINEAARFVAQRMLTEAGPTTDNRVAWAFNTITGRQANDRELAILRRLFTEQHDLFTRDPVAADRLLSVGEKPNDKTLDPVDLAAGTVLAVALFNHDAAIMRR